LIRLSGRSMLKLFKYLWRKITGLFKRPRGIYVDGVREPVTLTAFTATKTTDTPFADRFLKIKKKKPKAKVGQIELITATGGHIWCLSDHGRVRKPIGALPKHLVDEFLGKE
jgi:hypothetical protein